MRGDRKLSPRSFPSLDRRIEHLLNPFREFTIAAFSSGMPPPFRDGRPVQDLRSPGTRLLVLPTGHIEPLSSLARPPAPPPARVEALTPELRGCDRGTSTSMTA